jgi:hypothetical protein
VRDARPALEARELLLLGDVHPQLHEDHPSSASERSNALISS